MSEAPTATWRIWGDGRGARTTRTGQVIAARPNPGESRERFEERLRWGRLDELAVDFIASMKDLSPDGTIRQYRSDLNVMVLPRLGDMWLVDCDATSYDAFAKDILQAKGRDRHAAAKRTMGALISWAHEQQRWPVGVPAFGGADHRKAYDRSLRRNAPVSSADKHRGLIGLEHCPTVAETWAFGDALGAAAAAKWGEQARPLGELPKVQYLTGARIATAFALRDASFNLTRGTCFIIDQFDRNRPWLGTCAGGTVADVEPPLVLAKDKHPDGHEAALWEWALDELEPILAGAAHRGGWLFATLIPSRRPLDAAEALIRNVRAATGYCWTPHWHRHAYASLNLAIEEDGGYARNIATVAGWLGDGIEIAQATYWHPSTSAQPGWSSRRPARRRA